jgi:hypothetical protein
MPTPTHGPFPQLPKAVVPLPMRTASNTILPSSFYICILPSRQSAEKIVAGTFHTIGPLLQPPPNGVYQGPFGLILPLFADKIECWTGKRGKRGKLNGVETIAAVKVNARKSGT